jgi:hypothetical protein
MNIGELTRLLEYVPKETAPDLHEKILGELVSKRHFDAMFRSNLTRGERPMAEEKFIKGLTEEEIAAWQKFTESVTLSVDECSA